MRGKIYLLLIVACFLAVGVAGRYEAEDLRDLEEYREQAAGFTEHFADPPMSEAKEAWIAFDTPELDAEADQFEELCQIVMDEGGSTEPDQGIRMMADGVLNRVDSPMFPDSIHDVIFQPGQFQPVGDGTFYKYVPTERVIRICAEEMVHRTDSRVLFWKTGSYHKGTTPIAHIGGHYYSGRRR